MAGIFAVVIGIIYLINALNLPKATVGNPYAPLIFPIVLGVLLTLFGALQLLKDKRIDFSNVKNDKNMGLILKSIGAIIIYALIFEEAGYVISTFLFIFIMMYLFNGREKLLRSFIVSGVFSVVVYIIFSQLLGVFLPMMPGLYI